MRLIKVLLTCLAFIPALAFAQYCNETGKCNGADVTLYCHGTTIPCIGTSGPDVVCVTKPIEVRTRGGDDNVCVVAVGATVKLGSGNDQLVIERGGGTHYGGLGSDLMVSYGSAPVVFRGGPGNDALFGSNLALDTLHGGKGLDDCVVGEMGGAIGPSCEGGIPE